MASVAVSNVSGEIRLFVWNAQGAKGAKSSDKWEHLWKNYMKKRVEEGFVVLGLIVEAGWAPWRKSGAVGMGLQKLEDGPNLEPTYKSTFTQALGDKKFRGLAAYWVPWVSDFAALKTNARCSAGAMLFNTGGEVAVQGLGDTSLGLTRPALRISLFRDKMPILTVYVAHLLSGYEKGATMERDALAKASQKTALEKTPVVIVGDFNIDLQKDADDKALAGWTPIRTGKATQISGGELDYALIRNNTSFITSCELVEAAGVSSDHGIIEYGFQRRK